MRFNRANGPVVVDLVAVEAGPDRWTSMIERRAARTDDIERTR
jgi:hypothetical protein